LKDVGYGRGTWPTNGLNQGAGGILNLAWSGAALKLHGRLHSLVDTRGTAGEAPRLQSTHRSHWDASISLDGSITRHLPTLTSRCKSHGLEGNRSVDAEGIVVFEETDTLR